MRARAIVVFALAALLGACGDSATTSATPPVDFREPRFGVTVREAVVYGTARTEEGSVDLLLDLDQPTGKSRPAGRPSS